MAASLQFSEGEYLVSPTECVPKYEDIGHEVIVRELTQNALDAARRRQKMEREYDRRCSLRFEIRNIPVQTIPGIEKCREHLKYMAVWEKGEYRQQKFIDVLSRLRGKFNSPEIPCLVVSDNGVGLNEHSMRGLIGEGISNKPEDDGISGGSHGVGHKTAFAASDMNYVLYGGVNRYRDKLRRSAMGHVIFPSHMREEPTTRWTGHAYLASEEILRTIFRFKSITVERDIPSLIMQELNHIERDFGAGSVVIIPAFNHFPGDGLEAGKDICELICEDIAKHFFVAVAQEHLKVVVRDRTTNSGKEYCLDGSSDVERHLSSIRGNDRARGKRLISGRRCYEAWQTFKNGQRHTLYTPSFGKVSIRIRETDRTPSRITVTRTGMFISDDVVGLPGQLARRHFNGCKPFHAILLFAEEPETESRADNVLRQAEDAGHFGIRSNKRDGEGRHVPLLFKELRDEMLMVLEKQTTTSAHIPDALPIVVHRTSGITPQIKRTVRKRTKTHRRGDDDSTESGSGGGRGKGNNSQPGRGKRRRISYRPDIPTSAVTDGAGRVHVEIAPPADIVRNAFLQLEILTGSDATCEAPLRSRYIELDLANSVGVPPGKGDGSEIRMGTLRPGSRIRLTLKLAKRQDIGLPMRAEIFTKTQVSK